MGLVLGHALSTPSSFFTSDPPRHPRTRPFSVGLTPTGRHARHLSPKRLSPGIAHPGAPAPTPYHPFSKRSSLRDRLTRDSSCALRHPPLRRSSTSAPRVTRPLRTTAMTLHPTKDLGRPRLRPNCSTLPLSSPTFPQDTGDNECPLSSPTTSSGRGSQPSPYLLLDGPPLSPSSCRVSIPVPDSPS